MLRVFGGAAIDLVHCVAELRTMDREKALVSTLARKESGPAAAGSEATVR